MQEKIEALASLNARIIGAEAERRRRLERCTSRFTKMYPDLRSAPLEAREDLVLEGSKSALRGWPAFTLALLAAAAIFVPYYAPVRTISGLGAFEIFVAVLVLTVIPGVAFYLRIRSHIKRAIESRYPARNGLASA